MAESFVGCDGDNPTKPPDEPRDNSTKHSDESTNVKYHERTLDIYEEEDRFGNKIEYQVYREKNISTRHGYYKVFDSYGNIIREGEYREGRRWSGYFEFVVRWLPDSKRFFETDKNANDTKEIFLGKFIFSEGKLNGVSHIHSLNGEVIQELNFIDGTSHQFNRKYYRNGNIKSEGTLTIILEQLPQRTARTRQGGQKIGKWVEYYQGGIVKIEANYKDGKEHGNWVEYYEDGETKYEGNYNEGELDGQWIEYYEGGNIKNEENYKEGKEHGKWVSHYEDGKEKFERNYKEGELDGQWVEYYEGGNKRGEGNYINGKEDGKWIEYYKSGTIKEEGKLNRGLPDGKWVEYYPDGETKKEGYIQNFGIKDHWIERWIYFYINGQISREENVRNGALDGSWVQFYSDGRLKVEGQYGSKNFCPTNTCSQPGGYQRYAVMYERCFPIVPGSYKVGKWLYHDLNGKLQEILYPEIDDIMDWPMFGCDGLDLDFCDLFGYC